MGESKISLQAVTAYASLLEQARLEAFFHAHWEEGEEDGFEHNQDSSREDEEGSGDAEGGGEEVDGSVTDTDGDGREDGGANAWHDDAPVTPNGELSIESEASQSDSGWSKSEVNAFFRSLSRRSRLRPDLIAEDLNDCKATSQVVHLIRLLDEAAAEAKHISSARFYLARAIKNTPSAMEVSPQWLELEEELADLLRAEQEVRDAGSRDNVVSWDEQVLNVALFLRHVTVCNPDSHAPNVSVLLSGDDDDSATGHTARTWTFSAQEAFNVISGQGLSTQDNIARSYVSFGYDHCVPHVPRQYPVNTSLLPWRLIYRCIEVGLLTCIKINSKDADDFSLLPTAVIEQTGDAIHVKSTASVRRFQRVPDLMLVWTERISSASTAPDILEEHRRSAARRLFATLKVRELRAISAGLKAGMDERSQTKEEIAALDLSQHSDEEAEFTSRGASEQSTTKGKRKQRPDERQQNPTKKRVRDSVEVERMAKHAAFVVRRSALRRFSQIGLEEPDVVRYFLGAASNGVGLLDLPNVAHKVVAAELQQRQGALQEDLSSDALEGQPRGSRTGNTMARLSLDTMEYLASRIRSFVEAVIVQIEGNFSHTMRATETRGGSIFFVTDEHVHKALQRVVGADVMLLGQPAAMVLHAQHNENSAADHLCKLIRTITRSDPPSHPSHALLEVQSKGQEAYYNNVQSHLHGLKALARGSWTLRDAAQYAGVRHDGVISATDGLVIPDWNGHDIGDVSKAYDGVESSEESGDDDVGGEGVCDNAGRVEHDDDGDDDDGKSIYEGSGDERVIIARRDVRRGKLPDRIKRFAALRQTSYRRKREKRLEAKMNLKDAAEAKVQESLLWDYMGLAPPHRTGTESDEEEESDVTQDNQADAVSDDQSADDESENGDRIGDDNDVDEESGEEESE